MNRNSVSTVFFRWLLLASIVAVLLPALSVSAPAPAVSAAPPDAPLALTNVLTLSVVSARTELNHPGGPVNQGDSIPTWKYLINVDNTGDPNDPIADCSAWLSPGVRNPAYPESCDWPSIRAVPGAAPIFTQGTEADFAAGGITLPAGKYLVSVLAEGYKIGGAHFSVPLADPGLVQVALQPHPLPSATMRIKVFKDISPTNGMFDAPAEEGLAGAQVTINDILGQVSTDVFGNPLCTTYDAAGNPTGQTNCLVSDANGDIVVPNLGPNRYDVNVTPPQGGPNYIQSSTLEGSHSWDTWLQEGGTGLDNEFVVAGEPFPWTVFGFVPQMNNLSGGSGGITGRIVAASVYVPQGGGLPFYGQQWGGLNGAKVTGPVTDAWIALSDLQNGDTLVYAQPANPDGTFTISGVPDGNYFLTYWDYRQEYILDWMQVTVAGGQMTDIGTPFLTGWFTFVEGYVFNDANGNGFKDPGEAGIQNYTVVLKDRDNTEIDRMTIAVTTDHDGYYRFDRAYPMGSWMILEAYSDLYYGTGVSYKVENQPDWTTVLGNGVDVGVLPMLGQTGRLDWGVKPYAPGTNGGIVGTVFYDTTRNELDARYQAVEGWAPGIPGLTVNLWEPVACGTTPGALCDPTGMYELAADGSIAKGKLLNQTTTETWEQPVNCQARDANGVPLTADLLTGEAVLAPSTGGFRCLEGPLMGMQFQTDFSTLDGNYGLTDGCFGAGGFDPLTGMCADASAPTPLPAGDYLVEAVIPNDDLGRPKYKVVKEEDINVFGGDEFVPQIPPPMCAGPMHTVNVVADPALANFDPLNPSATQGVYNPSFVDAGGSPYEGQRRPLCDVKLVTVSNGKSIAPTFNFFTDVPIPGKWKGYIIGDLTLDTRNTATTFGEKPGLDHFPIGVYDFTNQLLTTIASDYNGVYEVLLPSTNTINCPTPSGVCPGAYYILGNDPGQPDKPNLNYNPQYRTIGATFEIWPGVILPSDLAPTLIGGNILAPGSTVAEPALCKLASDTPQLFAVSSPYSRVQGNPPGPASIIIQGMGFGATAGKVTLDDGYLLPVTAWSDGSITVSVPTSTPQGPHQLKVTAANGQSTVNGLTFHVLGNQYRPTVYEVGPGRQFDTANYPAGTFPGAIQAAINAAVVSNSQDALVVVYPGPTAQWNPGGHYYENLLINKRVKLQGVGPGGIRPNGSLVRGSVIDGANAAGDTAYSEGWLVFAESLAFGGNQVVYEGPVVYFLGPASGNTAFRVGYKAAIDGFTVTGGTQDGFPNVQPVDPAVGGIGPQQGGGIFANAYARYLQITNNIIRSNGGAYAGAIRVGTPNLPGAFNDNQNDFIRIANNQILANGGTNLAGAIGLFSGAEGYEVAYNDICGNFSSEYGGGISHYGYSPNGKIHHNRIYFNRSYDEGGGIIIAGELPANPATLSPGAGPVDIYNNLIQANLGNDDGGGLRFLMADGSRDDPVYNVYNNVIVNNVSTHEGGGISINDAPRVRVYNNTIIKNISTATAMTSNGLPAAAGLSSSRNSDLLQATLPAGSPIFSDPVVFNNIFWDNRAGSFTGGGIAGIGQTGDPTPINRWDLGISDGSGILTVASSIVQQDTGLYPVVDAGGNQFGADPLVLAAYDLTVAALQWRGNANFVDTLLVAVQLPINQMGDYHIQSGSPAVDAGAASFSGIGAPLFDIDEDVRPGGAAWDLGADELSAGQAPPAASPLHFSTLGNTNPPGVGGAADNSDIYAWNGTAFSREFDATVSGLPGSANVDGLEWVDATHFYLSFVDNTTVPGLGVVQDEDVVYYNAGAWSVYFDGTASGLTGGGQDLDAIDIVGGVLYFSTLGNTNPPGVGGTADNSDIYAWNGTAFSREFDATASGLPGSANVDGLEWVDATHFYLSFVDNTTVPGLGVVQDEDVVYYNAGAWSIYFYGTASGLTGGGQDLDAFSVP